MIHNLNWRPKSKPRREHKPDPERTKAGLLARIKLLEHQKFALALRVEQLEEQLYARDVLPKDLGQFSELSLDFDKDGRFFEIAPAPRKSK